MEPENQITKCINQIRKRPGMYIGQKDIICLRNFLDGFQFCLRQNNIPESKHLPSLPFFLFHEYTAKHFRETNACQGYAKILKDRCKGDGEQALEQFFSLYDSFCEITIDSIKYTLSPDTQIYFYKVKLSEPFKCFIVVKKQQETYSIIPDVIPLHGYFISRGTLIDRFAEKACGSAFEGWTKSTGNHIFSENGFSPF